MFERRVLVAGSLNLDQIYHLDASAPENDLSYNARQTADLPGGHGGNSAVAAQRFGAPTFLLSAIGDDHEGGLLLKRLADEGVDTKLVEVTRDFRTGRVLIPVFAGGYKFMVFDADIRQRIGQAEMPASAADWLGSVLVILDVSPSARLRLLSWGDAVGARTIVSMCASAPFDIATLLEGFRPEYVIGNEAEMQSLQNCYHLRTGPTRFITTKGRGGCSIVQAGCTISYAGWPVRCIDSVGAGDCFIGILAASLALGASELDAVEQANAGAALSTTRLGAQIAYPTREEVSAFRRSANV